jgi:hypothetical protein
MIPWNKGIKMPQNEGANNHEWKGDNVGYDALHNWIRRRLAKPLGCNFCGEIKPLDLANKSHNYKRELDDWLWLCKKCHYKYDDQAKRRWMGHIKVENFKCKEKNCLRNVRATGFCKRHYLKNWRQIHA